VYEHDRQTGLARDIECNSMQEAAAALVDLVDCRHVGLSADCVWTACGLRADCLDSKDVKQGIEIMKSGQTPETKYKTQTAIGPKGPHSLKTPKISKIRGMWPQPLFIGSLASRA
jgi:hypothetical protein